MRPSVYWEDTRALKERIGEHLANIQKGFIGHSVSRHFRHHHNRNPYPIQVIVIERYIPHWRGNKLKRHIPRQMDIYVNNCIIYMDFKYL